MPIETNSEAWERAESVDALWARIEYLLGQNEGKAFSIKEIEEYLLEEYPHLLPSSLSKFDTIEGAKAARQAIVTNILLDKFWHSKVTFRHVRKGNPAESGLYFTENGPGINPIAEVDGVKDPNPDSIHMTLSSRFRTIEKDIDQELSDLDERVSRLECQSRQE